MTKFTAMAGVDADVLHPNLLEVTAKAAKGVPLGEWYRDEARGVHQNLARFGGVLLRDWPNQLEQFRLLVDEVRTDIGPYTGSRQSAGSRDPAVLGEVFNTTRIPPSYTIPLHTELMSSPFGVWPRCVIFYCETPASRGGETPLASNVEICRRMGAQTLSRAREAGLKLVRVLSNGPSNDHYKQSWQDFFDVQTWEALEDVCAKYGIRWSDRGDGYLSFEWPVAAIADHYETGESCWISLCIRESEYGWNDTYGSFDDYPVQLRYASGEPVFDDLVRDSFAAIEETAFSFPWRPGDVLLVDNVLLRHGRAAFEGERRHFVGMAGNLLPKMSGIECSFPDLVGRHDRR